MTPFAIFRDTVVLIVTLGLVLGAVYLLGGCTCRIVTRSEPANPAGRVLAVERCVWGTAGLEATP